MKLTGRGEFQIIDYLRSRSRSAPGLVRGIGDDCAVVALNPGEELLVTTDLLTEGVHFDLRWTGMHQLGRKSVSVNVSDLAAMGARPRFLFLSLAVPESFDVDRLDAFLSGVLEACDQYGAVLAGGDTCRAQGGMTVSVTAQGTAAASTWIARGGATVGDGLYVTGSLGDSALALQSLQADTPVAAELLARHNDPAARVDVGLALAAAALPTAMIDVSDGLLADLGHLLEASGVGATIDRDALPLSRPFREALSDEPRLIDLALSGGEDYELLFSAAEEAEDELRRIAAATSVPVTRIGTIVAADRGLRLLAAGREVDLPRRRGYKHFPETA